MNLFKLPTFALLSGIGWCIDFTIFNCLVALGHGYFASNLISATVAVSFVLVTARRWIFRQHAESLPVVVLKYVLWNVVAVTAASFLINLVATGLEHVDLSAVTDTIGHVANVAVAKKTIVSNVAKLLVTPLTMYANFVAVGYIIERRFSFF